MTPYRSGLLYGLVAKRGHILVVKASGAGLQDIVQAVLNTLGVMSLYRLSLIR